MDNDNEIENGHELDKLDELDHLVPLDLEVLSDQLLHPIGG
jgi:hypothetical protein